MRLAYAVLAGVALCGAAVPAAAEFPATGLLDDFDRPDGPLSGSPDWAKAWCCFNGIEADRSHLIESGRIKSKSGGGSPAYSGASAWLPLVAADVEAYVTWSALPTPPLGGARGSEIQVRTQSLPLGHLNYYSCEMLVRSGSADGVNIVWQRGEGDQEYIEVVNLGDDFAAGDVVGVRIVGDVLDCWRRHATAGGGFQPGDEELMLSAQMPGGLGAGYIVLRTTDTDDIRWDDFGGGIYPPEQSDPPPVPALGPLGLLAALVWLALAARRPAYSSGTAKRSW